MKLLLIGFLSLFLLNSCAVSGVSSEPMNFQNGATENGLIIGSITFTNAKPRFNAYFIGFGSLESDIKITRNNSKVIKIAPHQTVKLVHSGELNEGRTYLFAFERPPGKYELSNIRLSSIGYGGTVRDNFIDKFSIPFEVKKGEITYIGEIGLNEYASKGDSLVKLGDNYRRDIDAIKIKQPNIDWESSKKSEKILILKN
jgi:hypothetical protein